MVSNQALNYIRFNFKNLSEKKKISLSCPADATRCQNYKNFFDSSQTMGQNKLGRLPPGKFFQAVWIEER